MIIQRQEREFHIHYIIMTKDGAGSVQFRVLKTYTAQLKCILTSLWVNPDQRRKGIATAMMNAVEELIAQEGYPHATLSWSPTEAPQEIRDWYIRRGYKAIDRRTDEVILRKQLRQ